MILPYLVLLVVVVVVFIGFVWQMKPCLFSLIGAKAMFCDSS